MIAADHLLDLSARTRSIIDQQALSKRHLSHRGLLLDHLGGGRCRAGQGPGDQRQ
jgi:hypothetical protein